MNRDYAPASAIYLVGSSKTRYKSPKENMIGKNSDSDSKQLINTDDFTGEDFLHPDAYHK